MDILGKSGYFEKNGYLGKSGYFEKNGYFGKKWIFLPKNIGIHAIYDHIIWTLL